jgi:hypothetical protein
VFTPKAPVFTPESAKLWHDRFAHVVQLLEIDPTGVQQLLASHVFEVLAQLSVQDRAARDQQLVEVARPRPRRNQQKSRSHCLRSASDSTVRRPSGRP